MSESTSFFSFSFDELAARLATERGEPSFRAGQLFEWVYRKGVIEPVEMTNISRGLREFVQQEFVFPKATIAHRSDSADGTRKYLVRLPSGTEVEAVMIKQPTRFTLCVSSQVGCGMACSFCRTGTMGFGRHLSTCEILAQVRLVAEDAATYGATFSNIVFMGMGEPLHNFENVARAARILTDGRAFGMSTRKITISTVGLVPSIERFAAEVPACLAVSLNATTDVVRSEIMPVNRKYPIEVLLDTLRRNWPSSSADARRPRGQVTIEYVMLAGVNDTPEDLARLPKLLRGISAKVNLIPYNSNAGLGFDTPSEAWACEWLRQLTQKGVRTTIRWSKGVDIDAACGQLATSRALVTRLSKAPPSASLPLDQGFVPGLETENPPAP